VLSAEYCCCVLLRVVVYCFVLFCIVLYCFVLLRIVAYCCVLLRVVACSVFRVALDVSIMSRLYGMCMHVLIRSAHDVSMM
jgi:hypothetical protein